MTLPPRGDGFLPLTQALIWWDLYKEFATDPAEERRVKLLMELDALRKHERQPTAPHRLAGWIGDRLVSAGERLRSWAAPPSAPPAYP
jgi:hypothetical protein